MVGGRDASSCLFSGRATVNYSPINARISGVDTFCVNQPSALTANSSVTNGSVYKWNGVVGNTTFTPMNSGPVILEVQNGQCSVYDTVHVKVNNLPVIDLGSDTTLCIGAPFNVTINRTGVSYLWDDGGTSNVRNIVSTGKYFVRVTNDTSQCVYRDTLDVTNTILNVSISGDTNFCEGESALLTAIVNQNSGNQYLWSNASTLNSTSVATPGLVWVEINNNGCKVRDSSVVIVNKLPQFSLGNDTSICNSAVVNMAISKPGVNILWDDMTTGASRILSTSGTYFAKLTDVSTGCVFSDTIKVNHMNLSASISGDTSLCLGESTILYVNTNQVSGNQYLWPDNSTDSTFTTSNYGDVLVKVKNQHCTVYASRFVSVFPLPGFSLGNDTVLCVGNSLSLILNHPNSSYLWNDLSTSNAKTISTAGTYSVKLTNNTSTCFFSDSIDVAYNSYFDLIPNDSVFLCRNSQHTIDLSGMGASYNWPELATNNPVVSIASKGLFHVNVQDAYGCPQKDSIIIEVDALTLDLGNDTLVCAKDSVYLDAGSAANYSWLPIARNSRYYSAGTSGDVMLTITNNNGCVQRDTIAITVEQLPVFSLGPDQELCAGQVATLSPNLGNAYTYLWNDLSTNEVLKGHNDGVYWVEATSINNCKSRDSVQLTFYAYPIVQLGADRILCDNNTITLAVNVNLLHTIQWSTGSTSDSLIVSAAGIYSVEIFNEIGCSVTDQVSISAMNTPTYNNFELPVACDFKQITLSALAAKDAEYIWNTTSKDNFISVSDTGVFFVNKKNYCGSALDSFVVKFKEQCDCSVFTPNCFTPNNDGINDYFKPTFSCNFYDYELSIFNRCGEKVFTSNNSDDYWNGNTRSGQIAQQDVYVYLITYKAWNNRDLQTKQESGVVTLLK